MVKRLISLNKNTSSIWFGPRQSGKSTLIRTELEGEKHWEVNLLESDTFQKYLKDPSLFRKEAEYQIKNEKIDYIFVDEIQKIPLLTNEVHNLIEKYKVKCVMSGSSARKLRRSHGNMLGGRAIIEKLYPLTFIEMGEKFDLEKVLHFGSLVGLYFDSQDLIIRKLGAYVDTYLREEIAQEGLVRNFDIFGRFLDVAGIYACEIINYKNISRESGTTIKTIQNYFSILYETLIAFELPAWDQSLKRQLSKHPKVYFSDNGICNAITKQLRDPLIPQLRGKLFEQWLINEIRAYNSYFQKEFDLHFWRTERGESEVDLIVSRNKKPILAIEMKAKKQVFKSDLKGLFSFKNEYPKCKCICVSEVNSPYLEDNIPVLPFQDFLNAPQKFGL